MQTGEKTCAKLCIFLSAALSPPWQSPLLILAAIVSSFSQRQPFNAESSKFRWLHLGSPSLYCDPKTQTVNYGHCCWSVTKSCPALCDPRGPKHTRPPCPSPSPGVCSDSSPLSGDAIQPSHPLSSLSPAALNLPQHQGLFQ